MNDTQLEPDSPADPETAAILWKTESGNGIEVSYDPDHWPEESLGHFSQISVKLLDHIETEFALDGIFVGVPAIIGKNGIEKFIEIKLNDEEKTMFDNSVEAVRQLNSIASKME